MSTITYVLNNGVPTFQSAVGQNLVFGTMTREQEISKFVDNQRINIRLGNQLIGWLIWDHRCGGQKAYWRGYMMISPSKTKIFELIDEYDESEKLGLPLFDFESRAANGINIIGWDYCHGQTKHYNLIDACNDIWKTWNYVMYELD
ncbi:hypothetical protein H012_gp802 [Acanthamoeba polyphaga moumouvirus]|uniref:Uncharacterized protein n=1 Tax=Acanthamoeba polyphaga moumouvirus TaxID=1269028 RepID=L7RCG8_9VIRU|nr:hypothetical protein H012_gp802 [Acanthamoeba polyphaga moumouvirus]AGC01663.1 hypothetical protein Moumou_00119 [Acanthamoeba polyphaga moumouvirus]